MRTDHLPTQERVKINTVWQERVLQSIQEQGFPGRLGPGWSLVPSSKHEDTVEKTDCWLVKPDGNKLRGACKKRESGTDILVDIYEPFYGIGHAENKLGRDFIYEYSFYVCLVNKTIHMVSGTELKGIIKQMLCELPKDGKFPFTSKTYPTCQLRQHNDRWYNSRPKLLAFVDPEVVKGRLTFTLS